MSEAAIGLGANLGDKKGFIDRAVDSLVAAGDIALRARSPYYRTEPWGVTDQDWFVNACILVSTSLAPLALLDRCLAVETMLGRVRERLWGPREIDLDLLLYDDLALGEPRLTLPHPRLSERAFVLVPLTDIAPDRRIGTGTVREALVGVDRAGIERLPWPVPPAEGAPA